MSSATIGDLAGSARRHRREAFVRNVFRFAAMASILISVAIVLSLLGRAVAFVTTVAAGGILAMVSNTMIPEAFQREKVLTGLFATVGFLLSFALHELGG